MLGPDRRLRTLSANWSRPRATCNPIPALLWGSAPKNQLQVRHVPGRDLAQLESAQLAAGDGGVLGGRDHGAQ